MSIPHVSRTLEELADEIGFGPAILLSGAYGGCNIYIPNSVHPTHKLVKLFQDGGCGASPAMSLEQLYGGQTINIPPLAAYEELRKMSNALHLQAQGCTLKQIAESIGVSQATAKKKLEKAQEVGITARKIRVKKRLGGTAMQHLSNQFNPQQELGL